MIDKALIMYLIDLKAYYHFPKFKKMLKYFHLLMPAILLFSCAEGKRSEIISIDPTNDKQILFSEIVADYQVVNLDKPEEIEWGKIDIVRNFDDYIFLVDRFQTKTVTVFDMKGNFIKQLKRAGDAPGEYADLSLFTYDPVKNALVVYSRMQGVKMYDFETLEVQKEIPISERYFMGMEWLSNNKYFVIKEYNSPEDEGGFYVVDENFNEVKELDIPNYNASIEISYPATLSRTGNSILYNYSSDQSKIYELSADNLEVKHQLNFGSNNIDSKDIWKAIESEEFEREVFLNKKATFIQFFKENDKYNSFWFINGVNGGRNNLAVYDKKTGESKVIRKVYDRDVDVFADLHPNGILNNQYVSILNSESDLMEKIFETKEEEIDLGDDYLFVYDLNWENAIK